MPLIVESQGVVHPHNKQEESQGITLQHARENHKLFRLSIVRLNLISSLIIPRCHHLA